MQMQCMKENCKPIKSNQVSRLQDQTLKLPQMDPRVRRYNPKAHITLIRVKGIS